MHFIAGKFDFIPNCDDENYERKALLDGAGWMLLKKTSPAIVQRFGSSPYITCDPFVAGNLEPFISESVRTHLKKRLGEASKNIAASKSREAPADFALPAPDGLDYMPFQKGGIKQVDRSGKSAIIADDMGLGKTIQGIGVINGSTDAKRVLIICRANMRDPETYHKAEVISSLL